MTTHFITAEIERQESPVKTHQAIEAELQKQGEPLRWAVTRAEDQRLHVEAVVIRSEPVASA